MIFERNKMTQINQIRKWLLSGHKITSMQAIKRYGATRLSDIIYRLKAEGLDIDDEWITGRNRYGNKTTFKRYFCHTYTRH